MIVEPAPAKINLALHIRARRPDGYHELETLFAFCRDGDTVTVERAERPSFAITGPFAAGLAGERDNLVTRAAAAFTDAFGVADAHTITLDKHLPIASGIGGGSADAAATLRALGRLHGQAADDPRMHAIALALGSDVPACLSGRTSLGLGRGEDLRPLAELGGLPVLLANPAAPLSTAVVFAGWDGIDRGPIADLPPLDAALNGRNDLERPARALLPAIGEVLGVLGRSEGVRLARMSGSGATCFAVFEDPRARDSAAGALAGRAWWLLATTLA